MKNVALALLSSVSFLLLAPRHDAGTITVPGDHTTIQAAIAAASSGDVIQVGPGTWTEALDFANGSSVYVGPGLSATITDSLFLDEPVLALANDANGQSGDSVRFERNRVLQSTAWSDQLKLQDLDTVVLRDNVFALDPAAAQAGGAFSVINYVDLTIEGNTVSGFAYYSLIPAPGPGQTLVFQGEIAAFQTIIPPFFGKGPSFSAVPALAGTSGGCVVIPDPKFVDRANQDLHLLGSSPCKDAGPTTGSAFDVDLDVRLVPYDYGADEIATRSMWVAGDPLSGGTLRAVMQGLPGEFVFVGIADALLPVPLPTPFGDLELGFGLKVVPVGSIGASGTLEAPFAVPPLATPQVFYAQPLVGLTFGRARELTWGG